MSTRHDLGGGDVLLVVDVQIDFLPGGALAVPDGDAVLAPAQSLMRAFDQVALTQDWHPAGHASFASSYAGARPFQAISLPYGEQVLWPDHCVQGSPGARLHPRIDLDRAFLLLRKGANRHVDSYSAFGEADGRATGLAEMLRARGIKRVFACGLATDYCVAFSALDARAAGFETFVVEDACRAIDADGSLAKAWARMEAAGVKRIQAREILG